MSPTHPPIEGVALGFLAYFLFSCSDANVKALGGHLPVFEIGFFSTLFAALVLLFLRPRDERWRDAMHMRRPGLVALRGIAGAAAAFSASMPSRHCRSPRLRAHLPVAFHRDDPIDLHPRRTGRLAALARGRDRLRRRPRDRAAGIRKRELATWRRSPSRSARPAPSWSCARWADRAASEPAGRRHPDVAPGERRPDVQDFRWPTAADLPFLAFLA